MAILSLLAKLGLDKSGFDVGISAAGKQVSAFGKNMAASFSAAAVVAATSQAVNAALKYADTIQELSERLETSTKSSQEWTLAAHLNGEEANFVAQNFQKMEKALNEANLGDAKAIRNLQALGISLTSIKTISVDEAIRVAAAAINQTGGEAGKSAAMLDIFGKSASKVKVVLRDLPTATKFSDILPGDQEIKNVKQAADALDVFSTLLKGLAVKAVHPLITLLQPPGSEHSLEGMFAKGIQEAIPGGAALTDKEREAAAIELFRRTERIRTVAEDIKKIQERTHDKGISDEQKLVDLTEERRAIMERIAEIEAPGPKNPELRQRAIRDLLKNEEEIIRLNLEKPPEEKLGALKTPRIEHTKLGAIGGTLGAAGIRTEQLAAEQVRLLKELSSILGHRGVIVNQWR